MREGLSPTGRTDSHRLAEAAVEHSCPHEMLLSCQWISITEGQDSYRLAQATAGKGVKPLV
jgi:hypothetical protein